MTDAPTLASQLWVAQRPTWDGTVFAEHTANLIWSLLPERLRQVALAELAAGNVPESIQMDRTSWVLLVVFSGPPRTQLPNWDDVRVHHQYAAGNYCYDGTHCTYELIEPRSFLAFTDPSYNLGQDLEGL